MIQSQKPKAKNIYVLYLNSLTHNFETTQELKVVLSTLFYDTNAKKLQEGVSRAYMTSSFGPSSPFNSLMKERLGKEVDLEDLSKLVFFLSYQEKYEKRIGLGIEFAKIQCKSIQASTEAFPDYLKVPPKDASFSKNPWLFREFRLRLSLTDQTVLSRLGYKKPFHLLANYFICLRLRFFYDYVMSVLLSQNVQTIGQLNLLVFTLKDPSTFLNDFRPLFQQENKVFLRLKINQKKLWKHRFQTFVCDLVLLVLKGCSFLSI